MQLSRPMRRLYTGLVPPSVRRRLEIAISGHYPRVYDRRKFIFVHIPKTAGKSVCEMIGVRGACHLTYSQYERLLAAKIHEYFIFSVIRHPMDRLQSAWSYMRQGGNASMEDRSFKQRWIDPHSSFDDFVANALPEPEVLGIGKFRPQVDFLSKSDGSGLAQIQLCRFESLQTDLSRLPANVITNPVLPHVNASRRTALEPTASTVSRVENLYREDFDLLGYSSN